LGVCYAVLESDGPDFDVDDPNASGGCQAIYLSFERGAVRFDWDFRETAFRDSIIHYYIAATSLPYPGRLASSVEGHDGAAERPLLEASGTQTWRSVTGQQLVSISVWGLELQTGVYSPQAISLSFPSTSITASIGMTGEPFFVGDGDEILVFPDDEWRAQLRSPPEEEPLRVHWSL
jgi:hypothetical protein